MFWRILFLIVCITIFISAHQCKPQLLKRVNVRILKYIFIFWDSGWDTAPSVCKSVRTLWGQLNPDWTLITLQSDNIRPWLTSKQYKFLRSQTFRYKCHFADMLRTYLLINNGGVWVDATLMPLRPLKFWDFDLNEFSTYKPEDMHYKMNLQNIGRLGKNGKPVTNFFLASTANSYYLTELAKRLETYLKNTPVANVPYFIWHYQFDQQILVDQKTRQWFLSDKTGKPINDCCNLASANFYVIPFHFTNLLSELIFKKYSSSASLKLGRRFIDYRKVVLQLNWLLKPYYRSMNVTIP